LFTTESAAKRFLKSEIPSGRLEVEAQVTGLTIAQVRARRAERKAQLRKDRKEAAEKIKRGELHPFDYPLHLQPIHNENQGWQKPVPVSRAADYHGPKCNRTLRDFLPADAVGPMPALNIDEEIDRAFEGRSANYTCYLDADWRFDEIERDASRRVGHEYGGRRHGSIGGIVVKAIHDVEASFQKLHPNVPCAAVADFWRSWQIQRHIADFCSRLADSHTAQLLAGDWVEGAKEAERARVHVYRQLAAFAHEVLDEAMLSTAANGGGAVEQGFNEARNRRLRATVTSLVAARRMEDYMNSKGIGQTEFARKVGTTDRTLRTFRRTGKVRRDIFEAIASAMETTKEALLKPE
jgi:hypothetical protein